MGTCVAERATPPPVIQDRYDVIVVGGGNAALCAALEARRLGASVIIIEAVYDTPMTDIHFGDEEPGVTITTSTGLQRRLYAGAIVVASGGFEANLEWLAQYWGEAAQNFCIRGTPFNMGGPLKTLLDRG